MKPTQPKYTVIYDVNEKFDDDATVVTAAVVDGVEDGYYPVKSLHTATRLRKARRSCCGICCCVTSSICGVFLLLLVMIGVAYYTMIVKGVRMVTVETPVDFPIVTVANQELRDFSDQVDAFIKSILNRDSTSSEIQDLVIPARIVNGAISQSDYMRGHAFVVMKENEFLFQTSLPMDMLPGVIIVSLSRLWTPRRQRRQRDRELPPHRSISARSYRRTTMVPCSWRN